MMLSHGARNLDRLDSEPPVVADQELIARANAGDFPAFEALYWRYRDWVTRLAYRFTQDEDLALDVLQETFVYFMKKFPGFELRCELKTFLYPAVRNIALTMKGKRDRYAGNIEQLEQLPASEAEERPATEVLALVLKNLPELHREVLWLRFVDDLSLAEIALALGIPLGTVKSRLHTALETLQRDPNTRALFQQ